MDFQVTSGDITAVAADAIVVNLFEGVTAPGGAYIIDAKYGGAPALAEPVQIDFELRRQCEGLGHGQRPIDESLMWGDQLDRHRIPQPVAKRKHRLQAGDSSAGNDDSRRALAHCISLRRSLRALFDCDVTANSRGR